MYLPATFSSRSLVYLEVEPVPVSITWARAAGWCVHTCYNMHSGCIFFGTFRKHRGKLYQKRLPVRISQGSHIVTKCNPGVCVFVSHWNLNCMWIKDWKLNISKWWIISSSGSKWREKYYNPKKSQKNNKNEKLNNLLQIRMSYLTLPSVWDQSVLLSGSQIKVFLSTWLYHGKKRTRFHRRHVYGFLSVTGTLTGYIFTNYWYILGTSQYSFATLWR